MKQSNSNKKSKFDTEKQNEVVSLITDGATFASACESVGVSRTTEWRARKNNDIYKEKIETAKAIQIQAVEGKLFELCMDGNITAIIFYLKTSKPSRYNIKQIQKIEQKLQPYQIKEIRMV